MFFYEGTFIDRRLRAETLLGPRRSTKMSVARATTVCLLTLLPPQSLRRERSGKTLTAAESFYAHPMVYQNAGRSSRFCANRSLDRHAERFPTGNHAASGGVE